jgi:hypothetical protein
MRTTKIAIALLALGMACKGYEDGFAVDLAIDADLSIDPTTLASITTLDGGVSGADTAHKSFASLAQLGKTREERVIYRPKMTSGMLTFTVVASDAAHHPLGFGQTAVRIQAGRTAVGKVTLTTNLPAGLGVDVAITPPTARVGGGQTLQLHANTPVFWSVVEGATAGSIDANGLFKAGNVPGSYHVKAVNAVDPSRSATASVTVTPVSVTLLAGTLGGAGFIDGGPGDARFGSFSAMVSATTNLERVYIADGNAAVVRSVVDPFEPMFSTTRTIAGTPNQQGTADGMGAAARFVFPSGIAFDGTSLYVADRDDHTIRVISDVSTGDTKTLAGSHGKRGLQNGALTAALFTGPQSLIFEGGLLFVLDAGNKVIRQIDVNASQVTTLSGNATSACAAGAPTATSFRSPYFMASDRMGSLYVLDFSCGIVKVDEKTGNSTLVQSFNSLGFSSANGFEYWNGSLFFADASTCVIWQAQPGATAAAFAGTGKCGGTDVDGKGAAAGFVTPTSMAASTSGLFIGDDVSGTLRYARSDGTVQSLAGKSIDEGDIDGKPPTARMQFPGAIALGSGTLAFFVEAGLIRSVDTATGEVTTIAGTANNFGSTDGVGAAASFSQFLGGVAYDGSGNLYVTDSASYTIRKIELQSKTVSTPWGKVGQAGATDGGPVDARFSLPAAIAYDPSGNLFVGDGATIRQINVQSGNVTTLAGLADHYGAADGTGAQARFAQLNGLVADGKGKLFATDNVSVRSVDIKSQAVQTVVAGAPSIDNYRPGPPITLDGHGNLYVFDNLSYVLRQVVAATGETTSVLGVPSSGAVRLGPAASATMNTTYGLATLPSGDLLATTESAVVIIHNQ